MPNKTDRQASSLAAGITERLDDLGMSRRELSRRAGLSRQTIHNIEKEGNTNLKPSTFQALDAALRWQPGTSLSLALGQGGPSRVEERVNEYLCRIALHLSHMTTAQLELTLIMLEENELGKANHTTEQFTQAVGELVRGLLEQITALREANHKHAS
jgi:DNA-binding XRE family transcriptional regulator